MEKENPMIPKLGKWKNDGELISTEGKKLIIHFENVLKDPIWKPFDDFYISKIAYSKQIDLIADYIAYFIKYYDKDQEVILGYLKLKNDIDIKHKYTLENVDDLISDIYDIIFTPTVEKELDKLIDHNNDINIESEADGSKKYKTTKKYVESLEFNNQHVILMYKISYCMKIITPVMMHFFTVERIKLNINDNLIYKFFEPLLGNKFSKDINIYNKLYVYVKAKIQEHRSQNAHMYNRRDISGDDIITITQEILRKKLISENMFKYVFDRNPIGFNKTIVQFQLNVLFRNIDDKNITLLSNEQDGEGLSGMEKLEMFMNKLDEGSTILADLDVIDGVKNIQKKYNFDISNDEVNYMIENYTPCEIQQSLITAFFSRFFSESRNIKLSNKRQYCIMTLTLKKILLTADANSDGNLNISFLPFILTGNIQGKQEDRPIRNTKFLAKLEATPSYRALVRGKFKCIEQIRPNSILNVIGTLANSTFTYCAYEYQEKLGETIDVNLNKLAEEVINLLSAI